jgi:nitrite reductase/ring-hydroxylating ferredoxin subunit
MPVLFAAALSELPEGRMLGLTIGGREVLLVHHLGEIRALDGLCPHRNGPLHQGNFCDGRIVCPWHAWEFDAVTGEYDFNPEIRLTTYPVEVRGEEIFVELP